MEHLETYLLINESVVPDVFKKVIDTKKILQTGKVKTINEAVQSTGISRSTYYKYKDYVFLYSEMSSENIITLFFILEDTPGILSDILNIIAEYKANILTINQNIPVNQTANLTISLRTKNMNGNIEKLIEKMEKFEGIKNIKIIS